jgi:hypothetical protein
MCRSIGTSLQIYRNSDGRPERGSRFGDGYIELMVDWLQAQKIRK